MKILDVTNLIPVQIRLEVNGEIEEVFGYINYEKYDVILPDLNSRDDGVQLPAAEIKEEVVAFLQQQVQQNNAALEQPIPAAILQGMQHGAKFKPEDYIPSNLTVQLKRKGE